MDVTGMDIPRTGIVERRRRRRVILVVAGLAAVVALTLAVSRLKPAAPGVDRATVWIGEVERGPMLRQVRGNGTLVPESIRWIPAETSGTVEQRVLEPGAEVGTDSRILVLSNPQVELAAEDAASQLRIAEAELESLEAELKSRHMDIRSELARIEAEATEARLQAEATEELAESGLVSGVELLLARSRASSAATRAEIERERESSFLGSVKARLAAKQAEVEQCRATSRLRQRLLDSLEVRAGLNGVLQEVTVEVGQQVSPGTNLARVADPSRLMARLRVPATQARDLLVGQPVSVDTRNGLVPGTLARIDPAVREGTVTVDVSLEGELPRGARPDLAVDGTVEIERLSDVVYVGRPAFGQENGTVGLFRLEDDGRHASRVRVHLGRASVNTVEVVEGLAPGDEVILSDTSRWDDYDRIRLE